MQDIIARSLGAKLNGDVEQINKKIETLSKIFTFKGTKERVEDLPKEGNKPGDMWSVKGKEYVWTLNDETGEYEWVDMGDIVDLDAFVMKTDIEQTIGDSETKIMSQKAVRDSIENYNKGMYSDITMIQDYLFETVYDNVDYDFAQEYLDGANGDPDGNGNLFGGKFGVGGCSAVRKGNWYGRNFDWTYDESADFIVKVPRAEGRYASMGISNGGRELDNTFVKSGKYSDEYRIIPFKVIDGINEKGVIVNSNVVPRDKGQTTEVVPAIEEKERINMLALARFILDRFDTARGAVEYIKNYVTVTTYAPLVGAHYDLHYMVADENNTYIIEFVNNATVITDVSEGATGVNGGKSYITNFFISGMTPNEDGTVYTPATQDGTHDAMNTNGITEYGCGLERYNIIAGAFDGIESKNNMKSLMGQLKYTKAYSTSTEVSNPYWYTEFVGGDCKVNSTVSDFSDIVQRSGAAFASRSRDPRSENFGTWQTTHSCVYDIDQRKVYIIVQENGVEREFDFEFYYDAKEIDAIVEGVNDRIDDEVQTLNDKIDSKGHYLGLWDSTEGLCETELAVGTKYVPGDNFVVSKVGNGVDNLIVNGNFDSGRTGWTSTDDTKWTVQNGQLMVLDASPSKDLLIYPSFTEEILPHTTYTIQVDMDSQSSDIYFVVALNQSGKPDTTFEFRESGTATFTTLGDLTKFSMKIFKAKYKTGTATFNNILLVQGSDIPSGDSNCYKPNGSEYTGIGKELKDDNRVKVNDSYIYDGEEWRWQKNTNTDIEVDDKLDDNSINPVQNKVVTAAIQGVEEDLSLNSVNVNNNDTTTQKHFKGYGSLTVGSRSGEVGDFSSVLGGYQCVASGECSHAEGSGARAIGFGSHAEGSGNTASGQNAHAEGVNNTASGENSHAEGTSNSATYEDAHAEGYETVSSGWASHSEGRYTEASGSYSHAEGYDAKAKGESSHAEGGSTEASGKYSHVEGQATKATKDWGHAEGRQTESTGQAAHAEGYLTKAQGNCSHAEGESTISVGGYGSHAEGYHTQANESDAHAEGYYTQANGYASHAEGFETNAYSGRSHAEGYGSISSNLSAHAEGDHSTAFGEAAHAEGYKSQSGGKASHAEGDSSTATGSASHSEGYKSNSSGDYSHAEGTFTVASGYASHAEGNSSKAQNNNAHAEGGMSTASGPNSHAEGNATAASGSGSHSEGYGTTAQGNNSHAEGEQTQALSGNSHTEGYKTIADASSAHAEGYQTHANAQYGAHAEGKDTLASGQSSHAEGNLTKATNDEAHAEGINSVASGMASHAEGTGSQSSGNFSHAEGSYTQASGTCSHTEGSYTIASGGDSHAEGSYTLASGTYSHAEGRETIASGLDSHVEGAYNIEDKDHDSPSVHKKWQHIAGNGTGSSSRSNSYSRDWNGNAYHQGDIYGQASWDPSNGSIISSKKAAYEIDLNGEIERATEQEGILSDRIDALSGRGRFLSTWNSSTGLAGTTPSVLPYIYHTGDYFIIGNISDEVNYRPEGTSYTGEASTTIETQEISSNDSYWFDGSVWQLLKNTIPPIAIDSYLDADSLNPVQNRVTTAETLNTANTQTTVAKHFQGYGSLTVGSRKPGSKVGDYSQVMGYECEASGGCSHAEGDLTVASEDQAHAEGCHTTASGYQAHAEGYYTIASGQYSHAEGCYTKATGQDNHAEGLETFAEGQCSHAEGCYTKATSAHAEGSETEAINTAHAEGFKTYAYNVSHAEGQETRATGRTSHAEGYLTVASGIDGAHSEGYMTTSSGQSSHAEGYATVASGNNAHAEGNHTQAIGQDSHTEGNLTKAQGYYSHVRGICNIPDNTTPSQHDGTRVWNTIIGNGRIGTEEKPEGEASNAYTMDWLGNGFYAGKVYMDAEWNPTTGDIANAVPVRKDDGENSQGTSLMLYIDPVNGYDSFSGLVSGQPVRSWFRIMQLINYYENVGNYIINSIGSDEDNPIEIKNKDGVTATMQINNRTIIFLGGYYKLVDSIMFDNCSVQFNGASIEKSHNKTIFFEGNNVLDLSTSNGQIIDNNENDESGVFTCETGTLNVLLGRREIQSVSRSVFTAQTSQTNIYVQPEGLSGNCNCLLSSNFEGESAEYLQQSYVYLDKHYPQDITFNNGIIDENYSQTMAVEERYLPKATQEQLSLAITQIDNEKQDTLVSGTNIKTINNQSILGSGNIEIVLEDEITYIPVTLRNKTLTSDYTYAQVLALYNQGKNLELVVDASGGPSLDVKYYIPLSGYSYFNPGEPITPSGCFEFNQTMREGGADITESYQLDESAGWQYYSFDASQAYQEKLISGVNIKKINGQSVLGSGNIEIVPEDEITYIPVTLRNETLTSDYTYDQVLALYNQGKNLELIVDASYGVPEIKYYIPLSEYSYFNPGEPITPNGCFIFNQVIRSAEKDITESYWLDELYGWKYSIFDASQTYVSRDEVKTINGQSIIGEGSISIKTLSPMKDEWLTADSAEAAADMMFADGVQPGEGFLGTVTWDDLPGGLGGAECKAFVISDGIVLFEINSADTAPYNWQFNSWEGRWVEFGRWEGGSGENSIQTVGTDCVANGDYSVAEGQGTLAESDYSHAEGWATRTIIDDDDHDTHGHASHAEGSHTIAKGAASHAEGNTTESNGMYSHAEGSGTLSGGVSSHAEGNGTVTNNVAEHAEGSYNKSTPNSESEAGGTLHSIGIGTSISQRKNAEEIMKNGDMYLIGVGGFDGTNAENESVSTVQDVLNSIPTDYVDQETMDNAINEATKDLATSKSVGDLAEELSGEQTRAKGVEDNLLESISSLQSEMVHKVSETQMYNYIYSQNFATNTDVAEAIGSESARASAELATQAATLDAKIDSKANQTTVSSLASSVNMLEANVPYIVTIDRDYGEYTSDRTFQEIKNVFENTNRLVYARIKTTTGKNVSQTSAIQYTESEIAFSYNLSGGGLGYEVITINADNVITHQTVQPEATAI